MGGKFCTNCGAEISSRAAFCLDCGTRFSDAPSASVSPSRPDEAGNRCENCGRPTLAGRRRCLDCGASGQNVAPAGRAVSDSYPAMPGPATMPTSTVPSALPVPPPVVPTSPAPAGYPPYPVVPQLGQPPIPEVPLAGAARRSKTPLLVFAALLLTGGAAAAWFLVFAPGPERTIVGTVTVNDVSGAMAGVFGDYPGQQFSDMTLSQLTTGLDYMNRLQDGEEFPCPGGAGGGFDDLQSGTSVVVADGSGEVLGTTTLTGGTVSTDGCTFDYTIVVADSDFYSITVSHRGDLTYSREELIANDWEVNSSIG